MFVEQLTSTVIRLGKPYSLKVTDKQENIGAKCQSQIL